MSEKWNKIIIIKSMKILFGNVYDMPIADVLNNIMYKRTKSRKKCYCIVSIYCGFSLVNLKVKGPHHHILQQIISCQVECCC